MPESVTDRPTKAHEYLFLLSKSPRYFMDMEAIREDYAESSIAAHAGKATRDYTHHHASGAGRNDAEGGNLVNGDARFERGGRNKRSVWTVATQPFSFSAYRSGKTYKASQDCPEHGQLACPERWRRAGDGEPQEDYRYRIDSNDARRALGLLGVSDATTSRSLSSPHPAGLSSESSRTFQSSDDRRTSDPSTGASAGGFDGLLRHTKSTAGGSGSLAGSSDSPDPLHGSAASGHSTGSHRTAPAPATSPACTPSAETAVGTPGTPAISEPDERTPHTVASSISEDAAAGAKRPSPLVQTDDDSSHSCTCQEIVLDHFAVFPPKLIEPCVLAGSSPKACGACGAPWERPDDDRERVLDLSRPQARRAQELADAAGLTDEHIKAIRACGVGDAGKAQVTQDGYGKNDPEIQTLADAAKATLGGYYREFLLARAAPGELVPSCSHTDDTGTSVVLDPFSGAGTTGLVALQHGRSFIGIELNPAYVEMASERIGTAERLGFRAPEKGPEPMAGQTSIFGDEAA